MYDTDMQEKEYTFSFKSLFIPFTTFKAIHWLIFIGCAVFANMLFNGFVWDDIELILKNPDVHTVNILSIFGKSLINFGIYYRPVVVLYFSVMYSLFGDTAFFYHAFQLLLHISNTILLFLVFKRFFKVVPSFLLALLIAVHPMQVESISWISSIVNPLSFTFGLSAFLLSMGKLKAKEWVLLGALLLLSLMTKETSVLFFIMIVLYRFLFTKFSFSPLLFTEGISFGMYLFLRLLIGGVSHIKAIGIPIASLALPERLLSVPAMLFYYIKTFFSPLTLSIDQLWIVWKIDFAHFFLPLFIDTVFFSVIAGVGWYIFKQRKELEKIYMFFLLWFFLGLLPALQLIPLEMTVSDRWFYFPMIGLVGILGIVWVALHGFPKIQKFFIVILLIGIAFFSIRTIIRNIDWKDNLTLFTHDAGIYTNAQMESQIGIEYKALGNYKSALKHLIKSAQMMPCEENLYNVGFVYDKLNDYAHSQQYYLQAMQSSHCKYYEKRHQEVTYAKLGWVLLVAHNPEAAKKYLQSGIKEYPQSSNLWALLAVSEYTTDEYAKALSSAQKAMKLSLNTFTEDIYLHILNHQTIDMNLYLR